MRWPLSGSAPGVIEPAESTTAGWLCSRTAASVPTGRLVAGNDGDNTLHIVCGQVERHVVVHDLTADQRKRMRSVPFSCPSETSSS
jgi:hypothetical protein